MPLTKKFNILFGLLFLITSCSKDLITKNNENQFSELRTPKIENFVVNSKYYPVNKSNPFNNSAKASSQILNGDRDPKAAYYKQGNPIISPVDGNPDLIKIRQLYKSQMYTIADNSMGLNIFPGAIISGQSLEGRFDPKLLQGISNNIRPITISTSMPVSSSVVAKTSLPRPISGIELYNKALTDLENNNPNGIGAASLQVEIDSFYVYEDLKTSYGYNKEIDLFIAGSNSIKQGENHIISSKSALKIKFFQENFSIDMDIPQNNTQLFDPTGLDLVEITKGVEPVYVKSVTYGRMGIMVIESSVTSDKLYNAFYKQLGILKNLIGIDKTLTQEEKDIINEANIRVKYTGIGTDSDGTIKVNGLAGFVDVMNANKTYSKENPGVPIAFQLAKLSNHSIFEAPFEINYGPYDKPYARFEYENIETERYSSQGIPLKIEKGNVYLRLYKDIQATIPTIGFSLLNLNFSHENRSRQLIDDSESAYSESENVQKTFGTVFFNSKGTSFLYKYDPDISMQIEGPVSPSTPNNPRANMTGHTAYYFNKLQVENGEYYYALPTIGLQK